EQHGIRGGQADRYRHLGRDQPQRHAAAARRHARPGGGRHPQALRRSRHLHLRPRLWRDGLLREPDHLYRRRCRGAALSWLPDRAVGGAFRLHRGRLPPARGRVADREPARRFPQERHLPHHAARAAAAFFRRLPPRCAPDGDPLRRGRRAGGLLPRQPRHQRCAAARDRRLPPDRQGADHRGLGLQVLDRPALHVSAQRPRLCGEFPLHAERRPGGALCQQPGPLARHGPHPRAARGSRAECLDQHGAPRRLDRRQPLRLRRRRHRRALGPGAWRRQRGGAEDARRDRQAGEHPRVHPAGEGQERPHQAHGLRPPGLQELRPAREDHEGDLPRGSRRAWHQGRAAARHGDGDGADRPRGRLLRLPQALPECRLLFGHHPEGDGHPDAYVHRALRRRPDGGLGEPVEGADRGSGAAHRSASADLPRRRDARLHAGQPPRL
ncbi:MAG: Citrate synthase (si), partial [uncultured Craurococcus sp.]